MLLVLALALASQAVPPAIEHWRSDLREEFGAGIPIVWVGPGLQGDAEGMALAERQLADEGFRAQFQLMQAAAVTESLPSGGQRIVVLMNEAWRQTWSGHEAALLGHELGHVWLRLRRLPAPAYSGGTTACLAVHAGDIVQHVLIRAEMERRDIDHKSFLMKSLDDTTPALKQGAAARDLCANARQTAMWVDARLALRGMDWPGRDDYENAAGRLYPEAAVAVDRILELLNQKDLNDRFVHRQALIDVFAVLRALPPARAQLESDDSPSMRGK